MEEIAKAIRDGIAWVVSNPLTWWVRAGSPNLRNEPVIESMQSWMLPITIAVAVGALIAAGGRLALTRKADPLIDVGAGLLTIAATAALGVALPTLLLQAGDAWTIWVLDQTSQGDVEKRLSQMLVFKAAVPGVMIVVGIIVILLTTAQAILMLFRQASIVVLAAMLPLAATGVLAPATKGWFRKVTGWMLALIFYKPAAAAVYAMAFTMIGKGNDAYTFFMGFAMLILSIVALPVLLKFFTWTTGAAEGSSGGGGFMGAVLGGATAVGVFGGTAAAGGYGAIDQARYMNSGPGGSPPDSPPAASSPGPGPNPSPAPPGATPSAGTSSGARSSSPGSSGSSSSGSATVSGGRTPEPATPRSMGDPSPAGQASTANGSTGAPTSGARTAGAFEGAARAAQAMVAAAEAGRATRQAAQNATGADSVPSGYQVRLAPGSTPHDTEGSDR